MLPAHEEILSIQLVTNNKYARQVRSCAAGFRTRVKLCKVSWRTKVWYKGQSMNHVIMHTRAKRKAELTTNHCQIPSHACGKNRPIRFHLFVCIVSCLDHLQAKLYDFCGKVLRNNHPSHLSRILHHYILTRISQKKYKSVSIYRFDMQSVIKIHMKCNSCSVIDKVL
jgi:hypothetical protein